MKIMAEFAYYPLAKKEYQDIIKEIVTECSNFNLELSHTAMSTIVTGDHSEILRLVNHLITKYFSSFLSILEVKYSNACFSKDN
jgi:uncharacterized protein YqgV (UPF0045/DUF77 family)